MYMFINFGMVDTFHESRAATLPAPGFALSFKIWVVPRRMQIRCCFVPCALLPLLLKLCATCTCVFYAMLGPRVMTCGQCFGVRDSWQCNYNIIVDHVFSSEL